MHTKRLLVGLSSASVLVAMPVSLSAAPAEAATFTSRVVLAPQALSVYRAGAIIVIRGQVQVRAGDGAWYFVPPGFAPDDTVKLFRTPRGGTRTLVRTVRLDQARGVVTFRVRSRGNATYSLSYSGATNGTDTYQPATLGRAIKGSRNPNGRGVIRKGRAFYVGDVNPGWAGRPVVIQRRTCPKCAWQRFTQVRSDRFGRYAVLVGAPGKGSWWFRSKVAASLPQYAVGFGNQVRTYSLPTRRVGTS